MPVTETSRRAYGDQIRTGRAATQTDRIIECLASHQVPLTRAAISKLTLIPINAVTGRVAPILEDPDLRDGLTRPSPNGARGPARIRVAYEDVDPQTGARAQYLELIPIGRHPTQLWMPIR